MAHSPSEALPNADGITPHVDPQVAGSPGASPRETPQSLTTPFDEQRTAPQQSPEFAALVLAPTHLGNYDLLEEIAHGGMGVVYKARDTVLGRDVAVKMIRTAH